MPKRICPYCHKCVPIGTKCECEIKINEEINRKRALQREKKKTEEDREKDRERYKEYNKKRYDENKEYIKFYNSKQWIRLREMIKDRQGLDLYLFMNNGEIVTDDLYVHHIVTTKEDWSRRLDSNNLICLSFNTHEYIHREYNKSETRKKELQQILEYYVRKWEEIKNLD